MGRLVFAARAPGAGVVAERGSGRDGARATGLAVAEIFGVTLFVMWEEIVRGLQISPILLLAPSVIAVWGAASTSIL